MNIIRPFLPASPRLRFPLQRNIRSVCSFHRPYSLGARMAVLTYPTTHSEVDAKNRGAFYTDFRVAQFLAKWSIRWATDRVLDPSFGGGIFLRAAGERLTSLGSSRNLALFGVEIDIRPCCRSGKTLL